MTQNERATETVYVTKRVHRRLKKIGADQGKSIGAVIEWLLLRTLSEKDEP